MPPRHGVQDFATRDEASRAIGTSLRRGPHLAPSKQRLEVIGGVPVVVKFPLSLPVRPIVVALTVEAGSTTNLVFGDVESRRGWYHSPACSTEWCAPRYQGPRSHRR